MNALWTGEAMAAAMHGRPIGTMPEAVTGISIDSRSLQPGDAFLAIKGETFDGHDFATAAIRAGASVMVIAEGKLPALGRVTVPLIVVPDVLKALVRLGLSARARTAAKIIAITGSAGKTSTKEAMRHAFSAVGRVHASDKSFNNHWGVPLTLARMPADADYGIFEIGMNHPGEIRALVAMVRPDIAVVTLIAAAHIGHFTGLNEIAEAKAEIFEGVVPGGYALVNRDDPQWGRLSRLAREAGVEGVLGFGEHPLSDIRLIACTLAGDHSLIAVKIGDREVGAKIGAPGRHIVQNALAVLGAAALADADLPAVAEALGSLTAEAGRGRRHLLRHPGGTITLIDESYNANPASMRAAMELLRTTEVGDGGRRIAVLGDMLELGTHSAELHAGLAEAVGAAGIDILVAAGPEMLALAQAVEGGIQLEYREDPAELGTLLLDLVQPGDALVVKSSNGTGFSRIVAALVSAFPPEGVSHAV